MDQDNLNPTPATPASTTGDLQAQVDALRNLLNTVLVLALVVSGTLNIYFLRQYRNAKGDLRSIQTQATAMVAEYEKTTGPAMDEFIRKVTEYGRTHSDFAPIMNKYQLNKSASTGAAPATAVAPGGPKKK